MLRRPRSRLLRPSLLGLLALSLACGGGSEAEGKAKEGTKAPPAAAGQAKAGDEALSMAFAKSCGSVSSGS